MDNLGQYLRSLREEKQLTLEAVKAEIKLSIEQLTAIENNQLSRLGDLGIARAIVYTYTRFLNADEKRTMYMFDLLMPPYTKRGFTPKKPLKEKKVLISTNFIWMVTIILIVICLGSIILISYNKGYLKRPFDKSLATQDTVNVSDRASVLQEKPDTLRTRMLELTNKAKKPADNKTTVKKKSRPNTKDALADTTDYVDGLLFESKESPFNPRI